MTVAAEALTLEGLIKAQAYGLGFDLVGIARLGEVESAAAFEAWLGKGYAGEMDYLARGAEKRRDSRLPFPGAVSAIVVGLNYGGCEPDGPVARYARGDDYHEVMTARLDQLHGWLEQEAAHRIGGKSYVDTGPLLERDLARRAGLGWFGKNTNLVNPDLGSFFFIGCLLVDLDLVADEPFAADRCGTCTRCLDACPTDAFAAPRVLDATRCISYLTIEAKGPTPPELGKKFGELLYGCDICQSVCPWNVRFSRGLEEDSPFKPREAVGAKTGRALADELLLMSQEEFSTAFRRSPMKRAKLQGLKRNAEVLLGNLGAAP